MFKKHISVIVRCPQTFGHFVYLKDAGLSQAMLKAEREPGGGSGLISASR